MAVVNGALREWFASEMQTETETETEMTEGKMLQKSMVRSFAWCPPLKAPVEGETEGYFVADGASRWGVQLLEVTNDNNEVIFLRVQESSPFSFEVLTVTSLRGEDNNENDTGSSLLSSAFKTRIKTLSVACGPWVPQDDERPGVYAVTSNVAVAYGKTLKTVKLDIELTRQEGYKSVAKSEENGAISKHVQGCSMTGPFQWIQMVRTTSCKLAHSDQANLRYRMMRSCLLLVPLQSLSRYQSPLLHTWAREPSPRLKYANGHSTRAQMKQGIGSPSAVRLLYHCPLHELADKT